MLTTLLRRTANTSQSFDILLYVCVCVCVCAQSAQGTASRVVTALPLARPCVHLVSPVMPLDKATDSAIVSALTFVQKINVLCKWISVLFIRSLATFAKKSRRFTSQIFYHFCKTQQDRTHDDCRWAETTRCFIKRYPFFFFFIIRSTDDQFTQIFYWL